ncbi:MAG TPA: hypothetical protein VK943_11735 [Arenibaculum sp.]|nr:hypothetical protein [Arenibaculum sp.]
MPDIRTAPTPPVRLPSIIPAVVAAIWVASASAILVDDGRLHGVAGILAAGLAVGCVVRRKGMVRFFALSLGAASAVLLFAFDADPWAVPAGLERSGLFCAFLAGLYALRSSVETSPALEAVRARLRGLPRETRRGVMLWLGWAFSVPLAIGALSVVAPLVARDADLEERIEAATWGIRGMALPLLFSPFTVAMGLVTSMRPEVSLVTMVMIGLPLSLAAMAAPLVTGGYRSPLAAGRAVWADVGRALAPVLVLIAADLAVSGVLGWSAVETAIVLVAPFALAMAASGGRTRLRTVFDGTRIGWGRFDSEVTIFTSALVFAALATSSPTVLGAFDHAAHLVGPATLAITAMASICVLTMIGIHMVVPAVIALSVFGPLMPDGTAVTLLCLGVLLGWSFGAMTALGSISFLVATTIFRVPARSVAFGPNLPFMLGLCAAYAVGVVLIL